MSTWAKLPAEKRFFRAFLSHAHTDKIFVEQLYHWLSIKAGIPTWYDKHNLPPSANIATELPNAILQCRNMIIIVSESSIKSGWVEAEYSAAMTQKAKYKQYQIISIRIEDCSLPGFLEIYKCIDCFDKKVDTKLASELLMALYYDYKALMLENVSDLYISRSWHATDAFLPDHICQQLDKAGFRLIGDSEDQRRYNPERVQSLVKSCSGMVCILPNRGRSIISKYMLDEISFAQEADLPFFIIAETGITLSEPLAQHTIFLLTNEVEKEEFKDALRRKIVDLYAQWQQPSQPFYTFLATSFNDEQRNLNIKQAIQHITAMPCIIGDKIPESHIRELIATQISKASLVIADISDNNINPCVEAGIAIGANRPLRLIARAPRGKVPFMLGDYEVFNYNDDAEMLAAIHRIAFPLRRRVINSELPR